MGTVSFTARRKSTVIMLERLRSSFNAMASMASTSSCGIETLIFVLPSARK